MTFQCDFVEDQDENGNLQVFGVQWTEARVGLEQFATFVVCLLFFGGIGLTAAGFLTWTPATGVPIGLFGGVAVFLIWGWWELLKLCFRMPGRKRELTFCRDGTIYAPFGMAAYPSEHDRVTGHHADIVSIEARQFAFPEGQRKPWYAHGVTLYKRNGQMAHVAKNLEQEEAHMLAVNLTQALEAMREELATSVWDKIRGSRDDSGKPPIDKDEDEPHID